MHGTVRTPIIIFADVDQGGRSRKYLDERW